MEPSLSPNAILWQLDDTSKVKHMAPVVLVCKCIKIYIANAPRQNWLSLPDKGKVQVHREQLCPVIGTAQPQIPLQVLMKRWAGSAAKVDQLKLAWGILPSSFASHKPSIDDQLPCRQICRNSVHRLIPIILNSSNFCLWENPHVTRRFSWTSKSERLPVCASRLCSKRSDLGSLSSTTPNGLPVQRYLPCFRAIAHPWSPTFTWHKTFDQPIFMKINYISLQRVFPLPGRCRTEWVCFDDLPWPKILEITAACIASQPNFQSWNDFFC